MEIMEARGTDEDDMRNKLIEGNDVRVIKKEDDRYNKDDVEYFDRSGVWFSLNSENVDTRQYAIARAYFHFHVKRGGNGNDNNHNAGPSNHSPEEDNDDDF